MKKHKYKILVLSDLKKSSSNLLKSTVSLAKMINGSIEFFHVKKPTEIIEKENQLSANRVINEKHKETQKKIQILIEPISKDYNVKINYSYVFGNVKNEIDDYINECKPDIIVLGKRKSKTLNLIGDNITDFILNKHSGIVMIADNQNTLGSNKELSLGIINGLDPSSNTEFMENLMEHIQKPLKSFKIIKNSNPSENMHIPTNEKTIEYVFEQNDSTIKNLSNYLSVNNINLLCIDRGNKNRENLIKSDIKDIVKNLKVSVLVTGKQGFMLK